MSKLEIRAPMPGTFYRKSSPDAANFIEDGSVVASDTVVGLIEVMKTFHEIKAGIDGKGIEFVVDDGDPIMAGQVIAEASA